jgi:hypothetical protein
MNCALVLSAIAVGPSSSLQDIVGTMDYLNRGWPSAGEFEQAIGELLGRGLIEEPALFRFKLTREGRNVWKRTGRGGVIERYIRVELPEGSARVWTFDHAAYKAAELEYHRSMNASQNRPS